MDKMNKPNNQKTNTLCFSGLTVLPTTIYRLMRSYGISYL